MTTTAPTKHSPGKWAEPEHLTEAFTLRAAGYTTASILNRTGLSASTLNRAFLKYGVKKGEARDAVIEKARAGMIDSASNHTELQAECAALIHDDISQVRLLREKLAESLEHLQARNLHEATQVARAGAAFSTALKNTSELLEKRVGPEARRLMPSSLPPDDPYQRAQEETFASLLRSCGSIDEKVTKE